MANGWHPTKKTLTKSEIAKAIAKKAGIQQKTAAEILEHIADLAYKNAKNSFTLPGSANSSWSIEKPEWEGTLRLANEYKYPRKRS